MTQVAETNGSAGGVAPSPSGTPGVVPRTSVDPTVIAGIAAIAATQVPGVRLHVASSERADLWGRSELWGRPGPWAAAGAVPAARPGLAGSLPFAADPEPPVRSWCDEPGTVGVALVVEVELDPDGSRPIPVVAQDVRREVIAAMTAMTRLQVTRCDVHVAAIHTPSRPSQPSQVPASVEPARAARSTDAATLARPAPPAHLTQLADLVEQETAPALPQALVPDGLSARLPGDPRAPQLPRPRTGEPLSAPKPAQDPAQDPAQAHVQTQAPESSHHG